jgi:hypothetical protein
MIRRSKMMITQHLFSSRQIVFPLHSSNLSVINKIGLNLVSPKFKKQSALKLAGQTIPFVKQIGTIVHRTFFLDPSQKEMAELYHNLW